MQVLLLRMRLLAIRGLLRGVIALRSVLRRWQRAARIRVDPWVTVLIGRQRPLASSIHIFAACALTGFITGWQYEWANWAPSRAPDAVSKNSTVKPGDSNEAKIALEHESPKASTELTQTIPAAPHVVLLNPGTADHQESPQAPTSPAPSPTKNGVSRPDTSHNKVSEDRPSQRPRRSTQSYEDLRDYVLKR